MARVACVCGQLITQFLINGEPRTTCPFCHRAVAFDSQGRIIDARQQTASSPVRPGQAMYPPSVVAPSAATSAKSAALSSRPSRPPTTARFVNEQTLTANVNQLDAFVQTLRQSYPQTPVCPFQSGCVVASCRRAFACQALPHHLSGPWYMAKWALGSAGVMAAFMALMLTIHFTSHEPGSGDPPNLLKDVALTITFVVVAGLIGLAYAWLMSEGRTRHLRGLAHTAQRHGLWFWPLGAVPDTVESAFPILCPHLGKGLTGEGQDAPAVGLAASGKLQGHDFYLAQIHTVFDPRDFQPMGGFLKVAQAVMKPRLAFHRQQVQRIYLVAYFSEVLPHTPDLVVTREKPDIDIWFLKCKLSHRIVRFPDRGRKYFCATADLLNGPRVYGRLLELLQRSPGYMIQVVGGRLMVWNGSSSPWWSHRLPHEKQVEDLLTFAVQVRELLLREAAET